ncbi:MAG: Zn-ribbon domain-containing OB-fold protein [Archaeoglobaceae archaeon]|nr:Zn-ribbon domain-containing OB-fold protein [Archaeoglobaceae archaeon]MCX8151766.1 Zn-ribbon domain-containing OB-fold protein [Archaeoglobaceae archaeon]MDW8013209.1 Zn-ribbon domain-containing OB-fold protein [Archaeoglobaceae archaeon]
MIEKITDPEKLRHWGGKIELYWVYTSGKAGDLFFKKLKADGKFLAAKCKKCCWIYFPPRIYCPKDFSETEYLEVSGEGRVRAFTVARLDPYEKELKKPEIYALIDIDGTNGSIIHLLGEVNAEEVSIGMRVKPVLKPKEQMLGDLTDILYFKPI